MESCWDAVVGGAVVGATGAKGVACELMETVEEAVEGKKNDETNSDYLQDGEQHGTARMGEVCIGERLVVVGGVGVVSGAAGVWDADGACGMAAVEWRAEATFGTV